MGSKQYPQQRDSSSSQSTAIRQHDAHPLVYNLYNMRRSWVEGTSNPVQQHQPAPTGRPMMAPIAWGTNGAAKHHLDRTIPTCGVQTTINLYTVGSKTVSLEHRWYSRRPGWIAGTLATMA